MMGGRDNNQQDLVCIPILEQESETYVISMEKETHVRCPDMQDAHTQQIKKSTGGNISGQGTHKASSSFKKKDFCHIVPTVGVFKKMLTQTNIPIQMNVGYMQRRRKSRNKN
jgi:hypothetical protein